MNDRPTAGELIDAVRLFLEKELLPSLGDARLRFRTLVAGNVLAITAREMKSEDVLLIEEWRLLAGVLEEVGPEPKFAELRQGVLERNERLCALIRSGRFDDPEAWRGLAAVQRRVVLKKLDVANPKFVEKQERQT